MSKNTLSKKQRMIKASLFREAFAQKRNYVGRTMVLWLREGDDAALRLGVISSRKVSRRAVDRNLARRRLRAIFCQHRAELSVGIDVLVIARPKLLSTPYAEVEREFLWLTDRLGIRKQ